MIRTMKLKFGRAPGVSPEPIEITPITVFVGPNNSGKSQILSEIHNYCASGQRLTTNLLVDSIEFDSFAADRVDSEIDSYTLTPHRTEAIQEGNVIVGKRGARHQVNLRGLRNAMLNPNQHLSQFCNWYLNPNTMILDGKSRINLVNIQSGGDLQQPPQTSLQVLFKDDATRAHLRRILHDAFGLYFVVDPTHLGHLRIRYSPQPPPSNSCERGIDSDSLRFHSQAQLIEDVSDGVKAFTGMMTEIVAGDPKVLSIDEPEAFLHPSLAFKLGRETALASSRSGKCLFVSTHSANYVMAVFIPVPQSQ